MLDDLALQTDVPFRLFERRGTGPIHIDFETTGLDACDPGTTVVGLGLARAGVPDAWYFDCRRWPQDTWDALAQLLDTTGVACFNATFDLAWLWRQCGRLPKYAGDSYLLYKLLATEGHPGQAWTLESACSTVLGWATNQKTWLADALKRHKLAKGDMGRLADIPEEREAFGRYCAQDADASLQLHEVLEPQARAHPALWQLYTEEWAVQVQLLLEQQRHGLVVDRPALQAFAAQLKAKVTDTVLALRHHPRLAPHVEAWEVAAAADLYKPHVAVKRTRAKKADAPSVESGWLFEPSTAKSLAKWEAAAGGFWYRETRVVTPRNQDKPAPRFNWDSDQQLRWLLYECVWSHTPDLDAGRTVVHVDGQDFDVPLTDGGLPPVGSTVLPVLGEVGALLTELSENTKLLGYVQSYLDASARDGRIHHTFKAPGTVTGRLSGSGGVNCQQFPKVQEVLSAFGPEPGEVLVDTDVNSLEPRVIAFFSQDPTYLELFASGKPHDVYLYVAQALFDDQTAAAIRAVYYLPDGSVTKESVAAAKKAFKPQREIAKLIHLMAGYNAGARKMHQAMRLAGITITFGEVQEMRAKYWRLFRGVQDWAAALAAEREDRGGWVYNGRGRPLGVGEFKVRDLVNTFTQSTGHDCLLTLVWYVNKFRSERNVPMRPFHVNAHDCTTWAVPLEHAAAAKQVLADAYVALNRDLNASVALSGGIDVGRSLWDFKG